MVAESYRGRRLSSFVHVSSSCCFSFLPLRCLCSQRQKDKWLPLTPPSSRLWKAAVGSYGDSSASSPADVTYLLPDTLHFPSCLLKSLVWRRDAVELRGCQGECLSQDQCKAWPRFPPSLLKFLWQRGDGFLPLTHFSVLGFVFCAWSQKTGNSLHFRSHPSLSEYELQEHQDICKCEGCMQRATQGLRELQVSGSYLLATFKCLVL